MSQVVQPWIWLNKADTELAELKIKGVVADEISKETRVLKIRPLKIH